MRALLAWTVMCGCAVTLASAAEAVTPPAGTFAQVSVGHNAACAIRTDHTLACSAFVPGANAVVGAPTAGTFTQVSVSQDIACAIRTDQTLVCWGPSPVIPSALNPPAGTFTALAVDELDACAIRTDQTLACWGADGGIFPPPAGTFTALDVDEGARLQLVPATTCRRRFVTRSAAPVAPLDHTPLPRRAPASPSKSIA